MPRIFSAGPEESQLAQKPRIILHRYIILWVFLQISTNIYAQRVQISSEVGYYDARYQNFHCSPEKYSWKNGHPGTINI